MKRFAKTIREQFHRKSWTWKEGEVRKPSYWGRVSPG